jgi:methionyl-tRNA formyltransferase
MDERNRAIDEGSPRPMGPIPSVHLDAMSETALPTTRPTPAEQAQAEPMRLVFVTEDDPLYVIHFFDVFFREYPRDELQIVGITVSPAFDESKIATARRTLRLYGIADFTRLLARFAGVKLRRRSIEALARKQSLEILPTRSVNDPAYVDRVRRLRPDVIVSVAAPEIFKEELLASARIACVNLHSGRLPKYRGMMPTFWQMLNSEPHITVTAHEMAPKLDAGAVLGTAEHPIHANDRLARLMIEGKREGARLLIRVLRELRAGKAKPRQLDMSNASYFSFPGREEARELRRLGHSLL